jgi:predicted TIM-barrel fold metal-dependent hydrolase
MTEYEKRFKRANSIGKLIARLGILEVKIECRSETFYDRDDILEEVIAIREELDKIEL